MYETKWGKNAYNKNTNITNKQVIHVDAFRV